MRIFLPLLVALALYSSPLLASNQICQVGRQFYPCYQTEDRLYIFGKNGHLWWEFRKGEEGWELEYESPEIKESFLEEAKKQNE